MNRNTNKHKQEDLVETLRLFRLSESPLHEKQIEDALVKYLKMKGVDVQEQKVSHLGRYDLVVNIGTERYCLELKKNADTSCAAQLDRYARDFDGLVLVCWKASKPLRAVFAMGKKRAEIPIELVEIRKETEMF